MKGSGPMRGGDSADFTGAAGSSETASRVARSDDGLLLKIELPSDPKLLCTVRGALERLAEVVGLSAEDGRAVTRAVDEALTNIMRHAYAGRVDGPIEIVFSRIPSPDSTQPRIGLEILMSDHGPAVDPAKLQGRALDDIKPGGLGLHLIRESMDRVEYRRTGDTNQFRLVKYFESRKPIPNP